MDQKSIGVIFKFGMGSFLARQLKSLPQDVVTSFQSSPYGQTDKEAWKAESDSLTWWKQEATVKLMVQVSHSGS